MNLLCWEIRISVASKIVDRLVVLMDSAEAFRCQARCPALAYPRVTRLKLAFNVASLYIQQHS